MVLNYINFGTPWKSSAMKIWLHHDATFKALKDKHDIKIQCNLPLQGKTNYDRILGGNINCLMNSIKELDIKFEMFGKDNFDVLFLELGQWYRDIELKDGSFVSGEAINSYVLEAIDVAILYKKPIVMFDADCFAVNSDLCVDKPEKYMANGVYQSLKDYENFTLLAPMKKHPEGAEFVPFNVDPSKMNSKVKPKSERTKFSTYVGNNYFRSQFVEIFDKAAMHGDMEVIGAGWVDAKRDFPNANYRGKFAVTAEKGKEFFSNSLVGLYGNPTPMKDVQHFTLRHRDYLEANTFIVPENVDYFVEAFCLPEFPMTIDDIINQTEILDKLMAMSDGQYEELVKLQQAHVLKTFDCNKYVEVYERAFKLK